MNLAENAEAYRAGQHPGYVDTAWAGIQESIDVIADRGIKVVINGGSINPSGLAQKAAALVCALSTIFPKEKKRKWLTPR
jgi:hypothetical protein